MRVRLLPPLRAPSALSHTPANPLSSLTLPLLLAFWFIASECCCGSGAPLSLDAESRPTLCACVSRGPVVCRVHGRTLDDYIPAEVNLRDPSAVFRLPSLDILKAIITADVRAPSLRVDARALCTFGWSMRARG